jgi:hypothetical protein
MWVSGWQCNAAHSENTGRLFRAGQVCCVAKAPRHLGRTQKRVQDLATGQHSLTLTRSHYAASMPRRPWASRGSLAQSAVSVGPAFGQCWGYVTTYSFAQVPRLTEAEVAVENSIAVQVVDLHARRAHALVGEVLSCSVDQEVQSHKRKCWV